jgi:hypothetical protein
MELYHRARAATLCRLGYHCPRLQRIQKYDGGKLPQLCCHCYRILGWGLLK